MLGVKCPISHRAHASSNLPHNFFSEITPHSEWSHPSAWKILQRRKINQVRIQSTTTWILIIWKAITKQRSWLCSCSRTSKTPKRRHLRSPRINIWSFLRIRASQNLSHLCRILPRVKVWPCSIRMAWWNRQLWKVQAGLNKRKMAPHHQIRKQHKVKCKLRISSRIWN